MLVLIARMSSLLYPSSPYTDGVKLLESDGRWVQHQLPAVRVRHVPEGNHLPYRHGHPRPLHHLALRRVRHEIFPDREARGGPRGGGIHGHLHGRASVASFRSRGIQREPADHLPAPRHDAPVVLLRQGGRTPYRGTQDIRQEHALQVRSLEGDAPHRVPRCPHHQRRHVSTHVPARPLGAHETEALQARTRPPPARYLHLCQHRERVDFLRQPAERVHRG